MTSSRLLRRLAVPAAVLSSLLALAPAALAVSPTYFAGAVSGKHSTPKTLYLSADGTLLVEHITWATWGGATAKGTGVAEYHGCTPNCASAKPHLVKVNVVLSQIVSCSGVRYYSHVALPKLSGGSVKVYTQHWAPCRQ